MECIFCKIIKGEIDSAKVYEDENVFAFLDISPITKGHCLIVPKKHFQDIFDIENEVLREITITAKNISQKMKKVLNNDGIRLSQSNGKAAGQEVFHFHLHVIPRYNGDGLSVKIFAGNPHPSNADLEELKKIAKEIKNA